MALDEDEEDPEHLAAMHADLKAQRQKQQQAGAAGAEQVGRGSGFCGRPCVRRGVLWAALCAGGQHNHVGGGGGRMFIQHQRSNYPVQCQQP